MTLLERDSTLQVLDGLLEAAANGRGHVVLLSGEAGIGKTSVVDAFMASVADSAHVLWGSCDDLLSARPLGPIWDMALQEPDVNQALRLIDRHEIFNGLLDLLNRSLRPTVMIIEDIHWADDSTLDLVKFLGRRISDTHALMVLTYRSDEVQRDGSLRATLGDLPAGEVSRLMLRPLSLESVVGLAGDAERAQRIWEISGGNPFFVTQMLTADPDEVPGSIRDAMRSRVSRLSPEARELAEFVSVVPGRAEIELMAETVDDVEQAAIECEETGILEIKGDFIAFRHELARRAVEDDLSQIERRRLNRVVLALCEERGLDVARCAHHAREAGEVDAIVRLVPIAARRAVEVGSHREALQQLRALEPYLDQFSNEELADHYDLWASEEHIAVTDQENDVIEKAILLRRRLEDPAALGNTLLTASRIAWVTNRHVSAVDYALEAAEVLEPVGGDDLALAYSNLAHLAMLASDEPTATKHANQAMAIVGEGPSRVRAHALTNLGAVKLEARYPEGLDDLQLAYDMSAELGLTSDQTRATLNIAWSSLNWRELATAEKWIDRGRAISDDGELPVFGAFLNGETAILQMMRGQWIDSEATAQEVMYTRWRLPVAGTVATMVLGRIQTRQGLPEAKKTVLRAWEMAKASGEPHRLGPAAGAVAELAWLSGKVDGSVISEVQEVMARCFDVNTSWYGGDIAMWLFLAGTIDQIPEASPEPYRAVGAGDWAAAAEFWKSRGCPYELAVALSLGDADARIESLGILDDLGATPLGARIRAQLQAEKVTGIPRGPYRATRENPLGLTPRQALVLEQVADGLTNAEIADNLFISSRTVDHHVSAILSKLGATSRLEAVELARDAGVLD